jgi:AAA family ATP:ADP antiporter
MSEVKPSGPVARLIRSVMRIESGEITAVVVSFVLVLALMTAYSILKPVRDALGADWGNVGLSLTWTANFGLSLIVVAAYGVALTYVRFRLMIPAVYGFFALSFLALYAFRTQAPDATLVNQVFYIWVSVFSLFNLSVFWSLMTEIYNNEQARRVFGIIAAGTTVGAIVGPSVTALLIDRVGANGLLLASAALLFTPLVAIPILRAQKNGPLGNQARSAEHNENTALGTNPFSGMSILFQDRFLLRIAAFILFYVTINTFVYFELQNLTSEFSLEFRAKVWAWIEITTNTLTLLTAALVTGRVVNRFGIQTALALMPALVAIGVLALVAAPVLLTLAIFQIGRRVGNYAVTRPSREMLFTVLDREARFKSKPLIDVVVYRGGDVMTAWLFTLLAEKFGLGLTGIAVVISIVAVFWGATAVWIGADYNKRAVDTENSI